MAISQHAWVLEGLRNLVEHARVNNLPELRNNCQLAYDSALEEIGKPTEVEGRSLKAQRFVDALRELLDYAEAVNLPKTRNLLLQALASAGGHLDNVALTSVLVPFPVRLPR